MNSKKMPYKLHEQEEVSARLEMSPEEKPLAKPHALLYKGLKAVGGHEFKINAVSGKIQITFFLGSAMAAKLTHEGEEACRRRLEYHT